MSHPTRRPRGKAALTEMPTATPVLSTDPEVCPRMMPLTTPIPIPTRAPDEEPVHGPARSALDDPDLFALIGDDALAL